MVVDGASEPDGDLARAVRAAGIYYEELRRPSGHAVQAFGEVGLFVIGQDYDGYFQLAISV